MKINKSISRLQRIFVVIIIILILNIVYTSVTGMHFISQSDIAQYAKGRAIQTDIVQANRGNIYSNDGQTIASTVKKYRLLAYLDESRTTSSGDEAFVSDAKKTANLIAPLLGVEEVEVAVKLENGIKKGLYQTEFGSIANNLSAITKRKIEELKLPGIDFIETDARHYPMGTFASYLVGYATMNQEDVMVGELGIEKYYNKELSGINGIYQREVDKEGYDVPNSVIENIPAVQGSNIYLTINSQLQRDIDVNLAKYAKENEAVYASAAVMEAKTGKILAVSNYPNFDPNTKEIENYNDNFFTLQYECGSVFKPFVYANAIDDGVYPEGKTFVSGKYQVYDNVVIRDWNSGVGFGTIDYDYGLAQSSNVAIANLIHHYNDRESLISDYKKLGFFQEHSVDGLTMPSGVAGFEKTDGILEFITTGYGQGSTYTSYQLLQAYSVFANDGKMVQPYFVDKIVDPNSDEVLYTGKSNYSSQIFSHETITKMNELLKDNVNLPDAVGHTHSLDDIVVMGKTGTAEIARDDGKPGYRTDLFIKSFAGLAPYDDPEIVIYVTMECPAWGQNGVGTSSVIAKFTDVMIANSLAILESQHQDTSDSLLYSLDSYTNQSISYVQSRLTDAKVNVELIGDGDYVVQQDPPAGTNITVGDRVFIKTDSNNILLPDFTGWSRKDVLTYAAMADVKVQLEGSIGSVVSQSVTPGTAVTQDTAIQIVLE